MQKIKDDRKQVSGYLELGFTGQELKEIYMREFFRVTELFYILIRVYIFVKIVYVENLRFIYFIEYNEVLLI